MPETISVESQTPDHLSLCLTWGETTDTPVGDNFVRLAAGEQFMVPAEHAFSIRTPDGWQRAYALEEVGLTGPVDIEAPQAMSPRTFAPEERVQSELVNIAWVMQAVTFALLFFLLIQLTHFHVVRYLVIGISLTALHAFTGTVIANQETRRAERLGAHKCGEPSLKRFWRADLLRAQEQPILAEG